MPELHRIEALPRLGDRTVVVRGWVMTTRSSGKIAFVMLRDGTGYLQVVLSKKDVPDAAWEAFGRLTQETSVEVTGLVAYLLAVPNLTVTAPKDGAELIGLLRCALERGDGPFSLRYPRDKAPAEAPPAAEVAPVPYGSWEILRRGRDCALLAVGVMC